MSDKPIVSFVIPCHNKGATIQRAIASVMAQTVNNLECFVINDRSTDDSERIILDTIAHDSRFTYHKSDFGNVAKVRNMGVDMAHGIYYCALDGDDWLDPLFLEACVPELENDRSLGIAYTGLTWHKPDGHSGLSEWPGDFDYDRQLKKQNQVPTCHVGRVDMWKRLGGQKARYTGPQGAGAEDGEFILRAGAYGWNAKKVTDAGLFHYSWMTGLVSGNKEYKEPNWLVLHPWTRDMQHPLASVATPKRHSHPVRAYDEPSVSVIIPVGPGHENMLEDALDSLESQTVRRWECIVVVDTGSDLPERIKTAYPYMRLVYTTGKKGAGYARNRGVEHSRAPMILFLDCDDTINPTCLEEMLGAWSRTGEAVYSDYTGIAYIDDPSKLDHRIQIIEHDPKTNRAIMRYRAADYDCARAQRQPEPVPFLWNNVTTLMPRRWFDEAGGFDEAMPSYEDVDLAWRMARLGKCFHRIPNTLLNYNFSTGTRREGGSGMRQELMQYLKTKYSTSEVKMCNCKGNISPVPPAQAVQNNLQKQKESLAMTDDNTVLARYLSPNRGQHPVRGQFTKQFLGYRAGGDTFLVDKRDIALQPHLFQVVESKPAHVAHEPAPLPPVEFDAAAYLEKMRDKWSRDLDLETLPGVTAKIAISMKNSGFTTRDAILRAGATGLEQAVNGIGSAKAEMIIAYLESVGDNGVG